MGKNDPKLNSSPSLNGVESDIFIELDGLRREIAQDTAAISHLMTPTEQLIYRVRVAEDELKSAQVLAAIVAGSDAGIFSTDRKGVITSWNPAAEKLFGYTSEEVIGQSVDLLVPPDRYLEKNNIFRNIINNQSVINSEVEGDSKGGQRIALMGSFSRISNSDGKAIGISTVVQDISDSKKNTQALLEANNELVYQNEQRAKRLAELEIANEEKAMRAEELMVAQNKLQASLMETIDLIRQLTELRDPFTAGHEKHVGDLAKAIAAEMGFDESYQKGLMIAGYLHDTGKIIVPIEILCKPGKLSREEFNLVKNHVQAGYDLLKDVTFPWPIALAVLAHHERLDGSGYPHGLKADQISFESRILAVADVIDAMASLRPYREALGIEKALAEIERGRNTLYDGAVVDACVKLFREKGYEVKLTRH